MQQLRQRVQRALPYALGIALLQIALSLVGMVLLVRYLSPADYGVWVLLQGLIGPVELAASFGFLMVLVRSLPGLDEPREIAGLVWSVTLRRLLLTAGIAVLLVAAFPLYAARYELLAHRFEVRLLPAFLVPAVGSAYLTASLNALFEQRAVLAASVGCQLALLAATALGIVQGRPLAYFLVVFALATTAQFAVLAGLFARRFGGPRRADLLRTLPETEDQRRYRRVSWLDDFGVRVLSTDVDRYLIGFFSVNAEVAIYAVAATIAARLEYFLPHRMLQSVIEPAIYRRYEEAGGVSGVASIFGAIFKVNYVLAFGFLAVFLPLGGELLRAVFGPVYDASWAPTLIFLAFLAFNTNPLGMVIHAVRRPELLVFSKVVIPLNLVLAWLLVPRYGALGMAAATGATMVLKNTALFAVAESRLGLSIPWGATLRCAAAAALTAGAVRLVPEVVPLLARVALAGLVYLPAALWLGAFERDDARLAAALLPDSLRRRLPDAWVAPIEG
jgi:O-antigen/teichoic acid export membrane protein